MMKSAGVEAPQARTGATAGRASCSARGRGRAARTREERAGEAGAETPIMPGQRGAGASGRASSGKPGRIGDGGRSGQSRPQAARSQGDAPGEPEIEQRRCHDRHGATPPAAAPAPISVSRVDLLRPSVARPQLGSSLLDRRLQKSRERLAQHVRCSPPSSSSISDRRAAPAMIAAARSAGPAGYHSTLRVRRVWPVQRGEIGEDADRDRLSATKTARPRRRCRRPARHARRRAPATAAASQPQPRPASSDRQRRQQEQDHAHQQRARAPPKRTAAPRRARRRSR